MSDSTFFVNSNLYGTNLYYRIYSDKVFRTLDVISELGLQVSTNSALIESDPEGEIELSPSLIITTSRNKGAAAKQAKLDVYRNFTIGKFTFSKSGEISGIVTGALHVRSDGTFNGKLFENSLSLEEFDRQQSLVLIEKEEGTPITSLEDFNKYLPEGWQNNPFGQNLITVEKETKFEQSSNLQQQVLDADKIASGSWGNGTWQGKNVGDYRGFYFDGYINAEGLIVGDIYLDSDEDNDFNPSADLKIGSYLSKSSGYGAKNGAWTRFDGQSNGNAWGNGVNATFSITVPLRFNTNVAEDLANNWFDGQLMKSSSIQTSGIYNLVRTATWNAEVRVISVAKTSSNGDRVDATQIEFGKGPQGSVLVGDSGNDILWGRAGWDIIDGRDGDDLIRAGNGRDIITGGNGRDEMHGDFGWNTFTSSKDGFSDLIVVKSDQHMDNWLLGGSGHNPDGSKCDIIEGLDTIDKIKIIGVDTSDLTFRSNVTAHEVSGIGIYAKGALEALYTGGDLSVAQITQMTSGDLNVPAGGSYGVW